MDAMRYDITAYTASFRLPGTMGYQATAPVPPPSTIFGLLSAAVGTDVGPEDVAWIAYRFTFAARATDLEKIIVHSKRGPFQDAKLGAVNSVPIKREFLYEPHLVLYLPQGTFERDLARPRFPICLGRSQDVATVERAKPTDLAAADEADLEGVLVPFPAEGRVPSSAILGLPTYMQRTTPRTPGRVGLFHVITKRQHAATTGLYLEPGEELAVPLLWQAMLVGGGAT